MPEYKYREGYHALIKSPQVVGEKLAELYQTHGKVTQELVIKDAEDKNSVLHGAFDWNDKSAAKQWRLHTARHLIRSVVIEEQEAEEDIRYKPAFIHVNTNEGSQYQTLASVMSDEDLKNQVLNRAFKEFETLQKKYQEYEELFKIFRQVGIARRKFDRVNREERPSA